MDNTPEITLLQAALNGDQKAFENLTEPLRHELLVYGYRLLGSVQDAEDLTQETLLRAWTKLATFAGRSSFRAWLYRIATNLGLNVLARAPRRSMPQTITPANQADATGAVPENDPIWLEPLPDASFADVAPTPDAIYSLRESVSLAFMVALHGLPAQQRVTLLLRDVLDWHATEVAEWLGISVPAVNSALQRARETLKKQYHPVGLEAIRAPNLTLELQTLLNRYVRAWEHNDIVEFVAILKEDATFSMPPQPNWYLGREAVRQFFQQAIFTVPNAMEWRLMPSFANAQPAFALYHRTQPADTFAYLGLVVLTVDVGAIQAMDAFLDPAIGGFFGLQPILPATTKPR